MRIFFDFMLFALGRRTIFSFVRYSATADACLFLVHPFSAMAESTKGQGVATITPSE